MFILVGLIQNKEEQEELMFITRHALIAFRSMELSQGVIKE